MSLIDTRALAFLSRMMRSTAPLLPQELQAAQAGLASLRRQADWYRRLAWIAACLAFAMFWTGSYRHGWWIVLALGLLLVPLAWGVKLLAQVAQNGLRELTDEQIQEWQGRWPPGTAAGDRLVAILSQSRRPVVADGYLLRRLAIEGATELSSDQP